MLDWHDALTIQERISLFKEKKFVNTGHCQNPQIGKLRLNDWLSQSPFINESCFRVWLESVGLTEKEFLFILSDPQWIVTESNIVSSEWISDIGRAISRLSTTVESSGFSSETQEHIGFLIVIGPLIEQALQRLRKGIHKIIDNTTLIPFQVDNIEDIFTANLPSKLLKILNGTLILELNIARLEGTLSGETPAQRFKSFLDMIMQKDKIISLWKEYPVLTRQIARCLNQWVIYSLEFLRHLCTDYEQLRSRFSPVKDLGTLVEIQTDAGDSHRDGRSVLITRFSSGCRIVYKPRAMGLDEHFQELLRWINDKLDEPLFYVMKILDCGIYGWEEYIPRKDCTHEVEVERFYERMGGYLGILYMLRATDFHSQNVIAFGEHPVLIDLETLFQTQIQNHDSNLADEIAHVILSNSVLRVGLLPTGRPSDNESHPLDLSGIGAKKDQITDFEVPRLEGINTDNMQIVRKRVQIKNLNNRPLLNHLDIDEFHFINAITAGFTRIYKLILRCKKDLLSENGFLTKFSQDEIRVVLRPTQTYGMLLSDSYHPDVLHNALDRDLLLNQLWMQIRFFPNLARVILMELEDLEKGDIPIFTTYPESRDIWSSSHIRTKNFFDESGISVVKKLLQDMNEEDLQKQLWIIQASLATISRKTVPSQFPIYHARLRSSKIHQKDLLLAAQAVGDRLGELVIRGKNDASWIGLEFDPLRDRLSLLPSRIDLYDGLSGIALFLAYLGMITQNKNYTELARSSLKNIRQQIENNKSAFTEVGVFDGLGGLIYTLTHLGVLWNEPQLINEAEEVTKLIPDLVRADKWHDIIRGSAGCIAGLLCLDSVSPSDHTTNIAILCGNRLVARIRPMKIGIGWINPINKEIPLVGFSHGTTGIAWSLLKLANRTDNHHYKTTALSAIEYERNLFSIKHANWPDLRKFEKHEDKNNENLRFSTTWCHGSSGIGLARVEMLRYMDDPKITSEIDVAWRTTLASGFGHNHSLCHGDLGNLEFLISASNCIKNAKLKVSIRHILHNIMEVITNYGYRCGNPSRTESPGLMTGIAGIGYQLLRLAEPTKVPSVLTLSAPLLN